MFLHIVPSSFSTHHIGQDYAMYALKMYNHSIDSNPGNFDNALRHYTTTDTGGTPCQIP